MRFPLNILLLFPHPSGYEVSPVCLISMSAIQFSLRGVSCKFEKLNSPPICIFLWSLIERNTMVYFTVYNSPLSLKCKFHCVDHHLQQTITLCVQLVWKFLLECRVVKLVWTVCSLLSRHAPSSTALAVCQSTDCVCLNVISFAVPVVWDTWAVGLSDRSIGYYSDKEDKKFNTISLGVPNTPRGVLPW